MRQTFEFSNCNNVYVYDFILHFVFPVVDPVADVIIRAVADRPSSLLYHLQDKSKISRRWIVARMKHHLIYLIFL